MKMTVMFAALAALFIIACGDETDPVPGTGKTTGEVLFDTFKDYKNGTTESTSPDNTAPDGSPCENYGKDENGDGVITDCGGGTVPGDPGTGGTDGGYGAMPLCPEIIGLNFDTCPPEKGRPVFIIDFGRSCVLGMKCDYQTDPGQACPMVWAPVCGTDGWTYDNDCFAKMAGVGIAYEGECWNNQNCPDLAYPAPDFCPNGKIDYVYDPTTGCAIAFQCIDGTDPAYCKMDADCGAGLVCMNGMCTGTTDPDCPVGMPNPEDYCADGQKMVPIYDERGCVKEWTCEGGTPTDPTDPGCPAIDLMMPDCGNMKPEPIYDAAGCLTGYACPL